MDLKFISKLTNFYFEVLGISTLGCKRFISVDNAASGQTKIVKNGPTKGLPKNDVTALIRKGYELFYDNNTKALVQKERQWMVRGVKNDQIF